MQTIANFVKNFPTDGKQTNKTNGKEPFPGRESYSGTGENMKAKLKYPGAKNRIADTESKRTKTLWMNYRDNQMSIEDYMEVMLYE